MKRLGVAMALVSALALAAGAPAAEVSFHGDLNHRFLLYTNHFDWLRAEQNGVLNDGAVDENFGEIKYRFWTEAATNDGDLKGVFAVEIGGVRFGEDSRGGAFSGDDVNIETRWAYTDFQLPGVDRKARFKIGLQPWSVNPWLWSETAMGIRFEGAAGPVDYRLGWARGFEFTNDDDEGDAEDLDNFFAGLDFAIGGTGRVGGFGLYQTGDPDQNDPGVIAPEAFQLKRFGDLVEVDIYNFGLTGDLAFPMGGNKVFFNFDAIYQGGEVNNATFAYDKLGLSTTGDFDLSAWFGQADVGMEIGPATVTYTFWYTSGDDDPADGDLDGFLSTDIDVGESIALFEGPYSDDDYFSERHYLLDKGFIMNKLALDFQATRKLKLGVAGLHMMTAEDIEYIDGFGDRRADDSIGVEIDGYASYMLFDNMEVAVNAGYLFADDALDYFEVEEIRDGSSDEDIFVTSARVRYKF
jgi:hypothetical protein